MSAIGLFIIGHIISSPLLGFRKGRLPPKCQRLIAIVRYLSYRGFHVKAVHWNSAPLGVLLLGLAGTVFFFCELRPRAMREEKAPMTEIDVLAGMDLVPQPYYWSDEMYGGSPPLATRSGWLSLACMPFVLYVQLESKQSSRVLMSGQCNRQQDQLDHLAHGSFA